MPIFELTRPLVRPLILLRSPKLPACTALAAAPVAGGRWPPPSLHLRRQPRGSSVRAEATSGGETRRKKVAVAGAGWAGLAAAHHLIKQGYEVTLFGPESRPIEEVGLRGFWYPYRNIFSLVEELGISPFTGLTKAAYYSPQGLAYNASHLLPLNNQQIVSEASSCLIKCIRHFEGATVILQLVRRSPSSVIHFLPGSYKHTVQGTTSFPNLFIAGDWIVNRYGSFSKEKAYVTGLEAANVAVDYFGEGDFAKIIAVEGDEPHIETVCSLNRRANELKTQIPFPEFFLQ